MKKFNIFNLQPLQKTFLGKYLNKENYVYFLAKKKYENSNTTKNWLVPEKLINRPVKKHGLNFNETRLLLSNIVIKKKVIVKMSKNIEMLENDYNNAIILSQLKSPNFMKYLGYFECNDNIKNYSINKNLPEYFCQKDGSNNGFIFMEYFPLGSLDSYIPKNVKEIESIINQILMSLILGYIELGFLHNDLHHGNILVKKTNEKYFNYKINNKDIYVNTEGIQIVLFDFDRSTFKINPIPTYDNFLIQINFFLSVYNSHLSTLFYNTKLGINSSAQILIPLKKLLEEAISIEQFINIITK